MTRTEAINIVRGQTQMLSAIPSNNRDPMTNVMVEAMYIVVNLAENQMQDIAMRKMLKAAGVKDEDTKTDNTK